MPGSGTVASYGLGRYSGAVPRGVDDRLRMRSLLPVADCTAKWTRIDTIAGDTKSR
jgi:hypothetical protein